MGPAPSLATYETAAQNIYQPQLQAEQTTQAATHQANLNTLNTEKGSVGTQYDTQEAMLKNTVSSEAAQIGQMYTTHLLGNFSGLQGNDMGEMFAKANVQENSIETQRTNAINAINTSIANENLTYDANSAALKSKYAGLQENAAQSMYADAVKTYDQQIQHEEQMQLDYAKLNETANYHSADLQLRSEQANNTASNNYMGSFKATAKKGGGFTYTGPNGEALNLGQYASVLGQGNPDSTLSVIVNQLQNSGTSADQHALQFIGYLQSRKLNSQQIVQQLGAHAKNNPGWDWAVDFKGL